MTNLQGQLLIASPLLRDPNFERTVILIARHDDEGALGLILNRPTHLTLAEAWKQVSPLPCERDAVLFQGGPCEGPLIVLHHRPDLAEFPIPGGLCFTTEADNVRTLVQEPIAPAKFFVGYAGWSPSQLEAEMEQQAWLTSSLVPDHVFSTPPDLWTQLVKRLTRSTFPDIPPNLIPPDPSMN